MKKTDIVKVAAGAVIGAGLGLLFAPKSGKELRGDINAKFHELMHKIKKLDKEIKKEFNIKVKELKNEIKDLDNETVLKSAKEKAKDIKIKAEELVELAEEKGNKSIKKATNNLREEAIKVTKTVLKKLEENN